MSTSLRLIRRRIRSIQNTAKVTRAMEMIASSKMRRAQERVLAGRPYANKIRQVLADLAAQFSPEETVHPLLERRAVNKLAIIHITSDRGLCGGLNANMNRITVNFLLAQKTPASLIIVGRKGRDFMRRYWQDMTAEFIGISDRPSLLDTTPISRLVIDDYSSKRADKVYLAYTRFITTLNQQPILQQLLPVEPTKAAQKQYVKYIYEPDVKLVLAQLLPRFVEMQVYHAILESIASEQSARMVAMRNATDNANDLIEHLTMVYNKTRQETITKELLDIGSGAAVLT